MTADVQARALRPSRLAGLRERSWSVGERVALISVLTIVMGSLFLTTYSLALGDPVPHRIDAAIVGDPASHARAVGAVQGVADDGLAFRRYASLATALHAIDQQHVYARRPCCSRR